MIDKRSSVSDKMIAYAKRNNLINKQNKISNKNAKIIALHFSNKFERDLKETKKIVEEIAQAHKNLNRSKSSVQKEEK